MTAGDGDRMDDLADGTDWDCNLGRIEEYRRYSRAEAGRWMHETGHYGPWEELPRRQVRRVWTAAWTLLVLAQLLVFAAALIALATPESG